MEPKAEEFKRGRGRPPKIELVTIDQALAILKEELRRRYHDETIVNELMVAKQTIYNKINPFCLFSPLETHSNVSLFFIKA